MRALERVQTTRTRSDRLTVATAAVLVVLAAVVLISPRVLERITGKRATPQLAAPDDIGAAASENDAPFFVSRNVIEVRVSEPLTVRQLLTLYRLNKPYQRRQILEQLGNPSLDSQLAAGTTVRVKLTPSPDNVPATGGTR